MHTLHPDEQLAPDRWVGCPAPPPLSSVALDDGCTDDRQIGGVGDNGADALATHPLGRTRPAGDGIPRRRRDGRCQAVVQVLPLRVKAVGAVLVVLLVPVKPSTMEPFAVITAVYPAGATLTVEPL